MLFQKNNFQILESLVMKKHTLDAQKPEIMDFGSLIERIKFNHE